MQTLTTNHTEKKIGITERLFYATDGYFEITDVGQTQYERPDRIGQNFVFTLENKSSGTFVVSQEGLENQIIGGYNADAVYELKPTAKSEFGNVGLPIKFAAMWARMIDLDSEE